MLSAISEVVGTNQSVDVWRVARSSTTVSLESRIHITWNRTEWRISLKISPEIAKSSTAVENSLPQSAATPKKGAVRLRGSLETVAATVDAASRRQSAVRCAQHIMGSRHSGF